jgi:hypothetical protein
MLPVAIAEAQRAGRELLRVADFDLAEKARRNP